MREITIEQLEQIPEKERTVIDIRKEEEFRRGTFPGAVSCEILFDDEDELSEQELTGLVEKAGLQQGQTVYVLCHSGQKSGQTVGMLEKEGYDAVNVAGGYRAYLTLSLGRLMRQEEQVEERTAQIERSIIKKYRKPIWRKFTKALRDYELIQEGDKVAVCISGGKDSMLLAKLVQELQRHGQIKFEAVFLVMNPGYNEDNWKIIQDNAKLLGIPLTVFESDIFNIVAEVDKNPCYLCARMRRGYLYAEAKKLGCNKIALGHHFDDVIETILMGMLYSGKIETMMPKLHSTNFEGMELIRPLYLVKEEDIKSWRDYNKLHFIHCACRFTEHCSVCGGGTGSKREEIKQLIDRLRRKSDVIDKNIFRSAENINLQKVIGYHKDDMQYHFLDDYDAVDDKQTDSE